MTKKNKNNFETNIRRLEEISRLLDSDEIPLEDAIGLYEEGINLSKECMGALNKAEMKITELQNTLKESLEKQDKITEE